MVPQTDVFYLVPSPVAVCRRCDCPRAHAPSGRPAPSGEPRVRGSVALRGPQASCWHRRFPCPLGVSAALGLGRSPHLTSHVGGLHLQGLGVSDRGALTLAPAGGGAGQGEGQGLHSGAQRSRWFAWRLEPGPVGPWEVQSGLGVPVVLTPAGRLPELSAPPPRLLGEVLGDV